MRKRDLWFGARGLVALLSISSLVACQPGDTGGAALVLRFEAPAGATRGVLTDIVDTVRVNVLDGSKLLTQTIFNYDDLQGTVGGIPAGANRTFDAEALQGNTTVYRGTVSGITIEAGETTPVAITMQPAYTQDLYAPGQVTNLVGQAQGADARLTFTAVGNDGLVGTADHYELRWSLATIQSTNFASATLVAGVAAPSPAGTAESLLVTGLDPGHTYHFALRAVDAADNAGRVSNEAIVQLQGGDASPPGDVVNLAVSAVGLDSLTLTWTAPGDNGTSGTVAQYDLRRAAAPILTLTDFQAATSVPGPTAPVAGGQPESVVVAGLTTGQTYHFALRAADEVPNWSGLSNTVAGTPGEVDETPPAAVVDLEVSVVGLDSLTLTWTAPGDDGTDGTVSSYDLRWAAAAITSDALYDAATPIAWPAGTPLVEGLQTQTVELTGLVSDQTYHFALKARDNVGNDSPLSNTVAGTPADLEPPARVVDLQAQSASDTSVELTWTAPADNDASGQAASYDIAYSDAGEITEANFAAATLVATPPAPQAAGSAESLVVSPLQNLQPYFFALVSYDAAGNPSLVSNSPSATPGQQDIEAPDPVVDLAVEAVSETSLTLGWTAPGDDGTVGTVSAYDLRWDVAAIGDETAYGQATPIVWPVGTPLVAGLAHQTVVVTAAEIPGLSVGTAYHFALKATDNSANESALSNTTSGTPADLVAPEAVVDLTVFGATDTTLDLAWTAPHEDGGAGGAVDSYEIRTSTAPIDAGNFAAATLVAAPPAPGAPDTLQNLSLTLPFGVTHWVALISHDAAGNPAALSNVVSGHPGQQDVTPPAAPVVAVDTVSEVSVSLTWPAPGDDGAGGGAVSAYDLRWAATAIQDQADFDAATPIPWPGGTPIEAPGGDQFVVVDGLTLGQTYHFAVKAEDNSGNLSALSNSVAGTPADLVPPGALADLAPDTIGPDFVDLSWTAPFEDGAAGGAATAYDLRYDTVPITAGTFASAPQWTTGMPAPGAPGTIEAVEVDGLTTGQDYYFTMKARDAAGNWSAFVAPILVTPL